MDGSIIGSSDGAAILTAPATSRSASFHNLFHKPRRPGAAAIKAGKVSYFFNNRRKSRSYFEVTYFLKRRYSHSVRAAQNPDRQQEQRPQKRQNSMYRNPHDSERQQNQPHKRVRYQRQQGNRPAKYQQQAPQEESSHRQLTSLTP
jgi:hypothetical protein